MTPSRSSAVLLALAVVAGCRSQQQQTLLTVDGEVPGAVALFVRLIDESGPRKEVRSVGDADRPVSLPATVYLQLANTEHIGVAVWVADGSGTIVARAMTDGCVATGSASYTVRLATAPDGWSPSMLDRCRCDGAALNCPGEIAPDAGGPTVDAELATIDVGTAIAPDGGEDAIAPPADAGLDVLVVPPDTGPADAAIDAPADVALDAHRDAPADAPPAKRDSAAVDRAPDLAPPATVAVPNALFGFENAEPDWIATDTATTLRRDTGTKTEGAASLQFTVPAAGTSKFESRAFATNDLAPGASTHLSVDIFVNDKQTGDANTEMWVDCQSASVYGVYMGYKALTALRSGTWTAVTFSIPPIVKTAFSGKFADCKISFSVAGKGLFRYDRLGFIP